jgi:hypothetical protein
MVETPRQGLRNVTPLLHREAQSWELIVWRTGRNITSSASPRRQTFLDTHHRIYHSQDVLWGPAFSELVAVLETKGIRLLIE